MGGKLPIWTIFVEEGVKIPLPFQEPPMKNNNEIDIPELKLTGKGQANRLGKQHEISGGPLGIFGLEAQKHDLKIGEVAEKVLAKLELDYKERLVFRYRTSLPKAEINKKLSAIDKRLGEVLFVKNSSIKPDGGIIEVQDKLGNWRVVLVGESKHQGNDIEKIVAGQKQGKEKDSDLMVAGNAIERVHKNILEVRNFMLDEKHFPYVVFLQGSNFATETFTVNTKDGREVKIAHDAGSLNRIDRVTASSFGLAINHNYCKNIFVKTTSSDTNMLQAASLYFQCSPWTAEKMFEVMWEIVKASLEVLQESLPSKA